MKTLLVIWISRVGEKKSAKFKGLSIVERDLFAILMYIVAFKSTFSALSCVLDQFWRCLTLPAMQTLICAQN